MAPATPAPTAPAAPATPGLGTLARVAKPQQPAPPPQQDVIPPADAQWTILCYSVQGPAHVEDANAYKAQLIQQTGRRDWYVIHGRDASNLYFGFYRTINDPKDGKEVERARKDMLMLRGVEMVMNTSFGREQAKPFEKAAGFVQLSAPDPAAARADWNLWNIDLDKDPKDPARAYWSLQIMAFRDNPMRKEAAVQAVEALRKQGVDAFYYHGESISSVCVGAWPLSAVKGQTTDGRDARTATRAEQALVVTAEPLPDILKPKPQEGRDVVALSPRLEVADQKLFDAIRRFPDHAVNYVVKTRQGKSGQEIRDPSFLVTIPRARGNGPFDADDAAPLPPPVIAGGDPAAGAAGAQPGTEAAPAMPTAPSANPGRLRRIGQRN